MNKIKLEVLGLTYSQTQNNAYALILKEFDGSRRLPIIIGGFEAQSIAIQIEKIKYSRPLTHDLFKNFADSFKIAISEIFIYRLEEGVFYSRLICTDNKTTVEIDARTSDAISLALRFNCPIYTNEQIMKEASIDEKISSQNFEEEESFEDINDEDDTFNYTNYSIEELNELLSMAIEAENYEQASLIRDEISKREKK